MEKLKEMLERLFWKRKYIEGLKEEIHSLNAEKEELNRKLRETERLNRGLASDLMFYKRRSRNIEKGGQK